MRIILVMLLALAQATGPVPDAPMATIANTREWATARSVR